MWTDSKDRATPLESVVEELVPHIDTTYRTLTGREAREIEGFSTGGYGAALIGFTTTQRDATSFRIVTSRTYRRYLLGASVD